MSSFAVAMPTSAVIRQCSSSSRNASSSSGLRVNTDARPRAKPLPERCSRHERLAGGAAASITAGGIDDASASVSGTSSTTISALGDAIAGGRISISMGALAIALSPADIVIVMDVYAAREDPMPGVSGAMIADRLGAAQPPHAHVQFVPFWSEVAPLVAEIACAGDLVLTVGAGDVTMIGPEILRLLGHPQETTEAVQGQE